MGQKVDAFSLSGPSPRVPSSRFGTFIGADTKLLVDKSGRSPNHAEHKHQTHFKTIRDLLPSKRELAEYPPTLAAK